jgi:membrane protease YdiL (CAAX protease family)
VDALDARRRARQAIVVAALVYGGYALLRVLGAPAVVQSVALLAAFYFLPGWLLRRDRQRQARYQVGPDSPIPPWSWRGAKVALVTCLVVFPPFVLFFLWFYARTCPGNLDVLAPVLWLEGLSPWAGGIESYLVRLCAPHGGGFWPESLHAPAAWLEYAGFGWLVAIAFELFATALPEEIFHRGYLMSALEEHWTPRRKLFGVPFGLAAVLASLIFAVGHLVGMAEAARLVTFFPALLFAWLWRRSGSLWAPALVHTASNLLMSALLASTFPH